MTTEEIYLVLQVAGIAVSIVIVIIQAVGIATGTEPFKWLRNTIF